MLSIVALVQGDWQLALGGTKECFVQGLVPFVLVIDDFYFLAIQLEFPK